MKIIQSLGKCPRIHYLCVKEFLLRNKPIKALKSYLVLAKNENSSNNFFSYKAHCLFNQYLKENEANMKKEIVDIIKKKMGEINNKNIEKFNNGGNNMEKIKFELLNCENMFDENNEKAIAISDSILKKCEKANLIKSQALCNIAYASSILDKKIDNLEVIELERL